MRIRIPAYLAIATLSWAGCATTGKVGAPQVGQHPQSLKKAVTKTVSISYLLYLPKDYDADRAKQWPLILFLHGAGERGTDLDAVKKHGPPKLVDQGKDLPFIIVSPQCPTDGWWATPEMSETLTALLDDLEARCRVDRDREYLTGLSMGGFGTWDLAIAQPKRFAAIAPICGGGMPFLARRIKDVPVWVFHGGKDPVVPVKQSEDMVNALKKTGAEEVKLTVYPEAGHDSWTATYDNPELYKWFLEHTRKRPAK